jgi:hypothetical protein
MLIISKMGFKEEEAQKKKCLLIIRMLDKKYLTLTNHKQTKVLLSIEDLLLKIYRQIQDQRN